MTMGKHSISRAEAISSFEKGVNCCQTVLLPFADKLGYEEEEFMDLGACFGGGILINQLSATTRVIALALARSVKRK